MRLIHISEGLRFFKRNIKIRIKGIKRYSGSASQICSQIINTCWNQKHSYFQTSIGNFNEFYTRDFGFCIDSLISLGYKKKVGLTLTYAINIFQKHKKITTSISPKGIPFDFPCFASDSLPFIIRSLNIYNNKNLIKKHKDFLNNQIMYYFNTVINKNTGLVKKNKHFSTMKDHSKRISSCYSNCMVSMLKDNILAINKSYNNLLVNPFKKFNYKDLIKNNFWNGEYFYDDLSKQQLVAGDANIFLFYCNVFPINRNKTMFLKCLENIKKAKLDLPFPLKYTSIKPSYKFILEKVFASNYEGNTLWAHIGLLFISLVEHINKNKANYYLYQYKNLIEKHHNFIEVFNKNSIPYSSPFYYADDSMLWSSIFLDLENKLKNNKT